jgi:hypothetical protein
MLPRNISEETKPFPEKNVQSVVAFWVVNPALPY